MEHYSRDSVCVFFILNFVLLFFLFGFFEIRNKREKKVHIKHQTRTTKTSARQIKIAMYKCAQNIRKRHPIYTTHQYNRTHTGRTDTLKPIQSKNIECI